MPGLRARRSQPTSGHGHRTEDATLPLGNLRCDRSQSRGIGRTQETRPGAVVGVRPPRPRLCGSVISAPKNRRGGSQSRGGASRLDTRSLAFVTGESGRDEVAASPHESGGCQGMTVVHGISWDDRKRRTVSALAVATAVLLGAGAFATTARAATLFVSVIVRAQPAEGAVADQLVTSLGGHIQRHVGLINAVVADVPASALPELRASAAIAQVTVNAAVQLLDDSYASGGSWYNPLASATSMYGVETMDGAHSYWNAGYTGQGVGVAMIDSGVAPVNGLSTPGKVVNGPDLSFESQYPSLQYLDTLGHGTHMAGIIAGHDTAATSVSSTDTTHFLGMAPDAQILSVKVADAHGQTDVSQVLAAIDW